MHGNVYWFSLIGQVLGLIGALYTMANPFLSKKQAIGLGIGHWGGETEEENLRNPNVQELLKQSRHARIGLGLIAAGFLLQAIATYISK